MKKNSLFIIIFLFQSLLSTIHSQQNYGYSYDSTRTFLENILPNPFVNIDSIGASVEGRAIWMVSISEQAQHFDTMYRVAIHARTHPNEVQSQWLTQKIIEILIGDTDLAKMLRRRVVFNIVPMYNPDGVELEYSRQNANGVDLERNWFVQNPEPEVVALKQKYHEFMEGFIPINIMLNMHGDGGASKAYFYYHHENGTSIKFTEDQKRFIALTQVYYPDGIDDWDKRVTWTDGNPMLYPESWFWVNYQEDVLAITFEEISLVSISDTVFDKTANALLNAIVDYLDIRTTVNVNDLTTITSPNLEQNYPNPFNPSTTISYSIPKRGFVQLKVYDMLGREVATLVNKEQSVGYHQVLFNASNLTSGIYFYTLQSGNFTKTRKLILLK